MVTFQSSYHADSVFSCTPRPVSSVASVDGLDNYTVLDVNEGTAQREADAYIAAYAKGGKKVGEFSNPTQALDKAFELCPEG